MSKSNPKLSLDDIKSMNLMQKMHAVLSEPGAVKLTKKADSGMKFDTIKHDDVMAFIKPLLAKWRIGTICGVLPEHCSYDGPRTSVITYRDYINIDNPEERERSTGFGFGDAVGKGDGYGPGKAVSFADKVSILKTFCLAVGEDLEAEKAKKKTENIDKRKGQNTAADRKKMTSYLSRHDISPDLADAYMDSISWPNLDELPAARIESCIADEKFAEKVKSFGN